jgi:hypothetical protein
VKVIELGNTDHAIDVVAGIVACPFSPFAIDSLGSEILPSALLKHSVCSSRCHDGRHVVPLLQGRRDLDQHTNSHDVMHAVQRNRLDRGRRYEKPLEVGEMCKLQTRREKEEDK